MPGLQATRPDWLVFYKGPPPERDGGPSLGSRETGGGAALPIWMGYMKKALERFPEEPTGPPPSGLIIQGDSMYFAEYPPGEAISRVGLDQQRKESIDELLDSLNITGDNSGAAPAPISN